MEVVGIRHLLPARGKGLQWGLFALKVQNMQPVIQTSDLTRRFGAVTAVDRLSLEIYRGEIFGFLGHNGAGKTTTVRLLNGVLSATSGSAAVLNLSPYTDGPALRQRTGVLTETPALDERLSAYENLSIYADLYNVPPGQKASHIASLLDAFELSDRASEKVAGYSKGMKQRLALARALLHNPELLFLDEPTAGLDPSAARQVHQMITRLSREEGRTIFLCTHNLPEAQRLCDRIGVMEHGRLIAIGKTDELARKAGLTIGLEIETIPADLSRAADLLRNRFVPLRINTENQHLVIAGAQRDSIPELVAVLVNAGIPIFRVTPQDASLEDIYFALQGKTQ